MRVVVRLTIVAVVLIGVVYGVLVLTGVLGQQDETPENEQSDSALESDDGSALLPSPFTEASDLLADLGVRRPSGVTQTATIVDDPRNDFNHPLEPRALPDTDSAVDISGWTSLEAVEITDLGACPLNGPEFACGDHEDYFVACGDEPKELMAGGAVIVVGKLVAAPKAKGDDKSRRFTLSLDDGDPSNNWQASAGKDNDFRQGFDSFFHVERPNDSDDWSITKTTIGPDSMVTTGETGARAIIKNKFFIILVPANELPTTPGGIDQIAGGLIAESFRGSLPDEDRKFIADPNVPYSGDFIPRFEPVFFNSHLKATCP